MEFKNHIHLLYVPTKYCNMSCKYCYLGELTESRIELDKILETLDTALAQLLGHGYLPFNLSFHGGEVTTLPSRILDSLFNTSAQHYAMYGKQIKAQGFRVKQLHIKTNLLNFQKHWDVSSDTKFLSAAVWICHCACMSSSAVIKKAVVP